MGKTTLKLSEVDSTQLEMKRWLQRDPELANFSLVQAETQTGGRGRQDRTWVSPAGNLYVSILLRGPFSAPTWIPHQVAVALIESIFAEGATLDQVRIKWPNDLIVGKNQKLSGILCEKVGDHIIAGAGVNLVPLTTVDRPVVSLGELLSKKVDPDHLCEQIIVNLQRNFSAEELRAKYEQYSLFKKGDPIQWRDEKRIAAAGKELSRQMADSLPRPQRGTYEGIGPHGEMRVRQAGAVVSLFSEEVHLVRDSES